MMMDTFGKLEGHDARFDDSEILLQSIPYDGTSTWGKGADQGFDAFMNASEHLEMYDIETDYEVWLKGIHTLPVLDVTGSPEEVYKKIYHCAKELFKTGKYLTFFGGEHSISIGLIEAFREKYENLTVLQLDAHADLREEYMGTPYNHACALHKASKTTNLVQVGIRSIDAGEKVYMDEKKCFLAESIYGHERWMDESIALMTDKVYLTIDLDVFDPSVMPSTGTPEPGGMTWYQVVRYLRKVFEQKEVVGFDIVELAPLEGVPAPDFLAAKLYYKLLSYKYRYGK